MNPLLVLVWTSDLQTPQQCLDHWGPLGTPVKSQRGTLWRRSVWLVRDVRSGKCTLLSAVREDTVGSLPQPALASSRAGQVSLPDRKDEETPHLLSWLPAGGVHRCAGPGTWPIRQPWTAVGARLQLIDHPLPIKKVRIEHYNAGF